MVSSFCGRLRIRTADEIPPNTSKGETYNLFTLKQLQNRVYLYFRSVWHKFDTADPVYNAGFTRQTPYYIVRAYTGLRA